MDFGDRFDEGRNLLIQFLTGLDGTGVTGTATDNGYCMFWSGWKSQKEIRKPKWKLNKKMAP